MSRKRVLVGNLPFNSTEAEIRELFEQYGEVVRVSRGTGRARGFGFVELNTVDAESAIEGPPPAGVRLGGRSLTIWEDPPERDGGLENLQEQDPIPHPERGEMNTHMLLNAKTVDLSELSTEERAFLRELHRMAERDISYFEIARRAIGPGSPALRGRQTIDRRTAATALYLAAEDIATRAGIKQGLILAPEFEHLRDQFPNDGSHISAAQAANLIGISRAAVYKAINAGTLQTLKIGNVTVVSRKSAIEYQQRREAAAASPNSPPKTSGW